jgi:hypothetical protein
MGRASNTDVVAVVPPLVFTVEREPTAQLASVTVRSNTVVFNGKTRGAAQLQLLFSCANVPTGPRSRKLRRVG